MEDASRSQRQEARQDDLAPRGAVPQPAAVLEGQGADRHHLAQGQGAAAAGRAGVHARQAGHDARGALGAAPAGAATGDDEEEAEEQKPKKAAKGAKQAAGTPPARGKGEGGQGKKEPREPRHPKGEVKRSTTQRTGGRKPTTPQKTG